jgi:hypothetical protein
MRASRNWAWVFWTALRLSDITTAFLLVLITFLARPLARTHDQPPREHAAATFLSAPHNDPAAMAGITLGGDTITNDRAWHGCRTTLKLDAACHCIVKLPPASAAVVKISL